MLMIAAMVAVTATFNSCKDYEEDDLNEIKGDYATLRQELSDLANDVENCCSDFKTQTNNSLTSLTNYYENLDAAVAALQNEVNGKADQTDLSNLLAKYDDLVSKVDALTSALGNKIDRTEFENNITAINNLLNTLNETVGNQTSDIQSLKDQIANLEDLINSKGEGDVKKEDLENLKNDVNTLIDAAKTEVLNTVQGNMSASLKDVQDAYAAADEKLQDQINTLKTDMQAFSEELAELKANFNSLVTSVLIQSTYNPIFGTLSIPLNVQSNVLAAYYGKAETAVSFPGSYLDQSQMYFNGVNHDPEEYSLTDDDMKMIGTPRDGGLFEVASGATLMDEEAGNAGMLYLTVNPTSVNFDGLKFSLVNSIDEESPVTLGNLQPSSKKLTFGWTRGTSTNGFYEALATVTKENLNNAKLTVDFNRQDLQDIFNDVTTPGDGIDLMNIANTVYSAVNDICDATGVKASWTTKDGETVGTNSVLSQYSIAATAVKPLSFAFMKDYHIDTFYGVTRVKNFINNTIDGINIEFDTDELVYPDIKEINLLDRGDQHYTIEVIIDQTVDLGDKTVEIDLGKELNGEKTLYDAETGEYIGKIDLKDLFDGETLTVTVDTKGDIHIEKLVNVDDLIDDIYGDVNLTLEEVNTMIGQLQDFIDSVNSMIESINDEIESEKNSISDQINDAIDRVNNKLCSVVNGAHARLQPLALVYDGDAKEFRTLSQVQNYPTPLSGTTVDIIPTTYTADMIVAPFKKHIAVTNVFDKDNASAQGGNANCKAALDDANNSGDLNKVIKGSVREVKATFKKDYVYEIAYSALDYSGKVSVQKFYVYVK